MKQINITVRDKIAETDFSEVVSYNDVYSLKFTFDEEWEEYSARVAVVKWEGGAREKLFRGTECEMPAVESLSAPFILIGVYSIKGAKRLASTFVRLRCEAGTGGFLQPKPVLTLHDQVLDLINESHNVLQNPLEIGEKTYDGSQSVTVTADDLGLSRVAQSGSYNDLTDKPEFSSAVTSVNGKTGEVTIDRAALGLGKLAEKDTVAAGDISTSAVLGYAIANRVVSNGHIALGGVHEENIQDGAVTAPKLAADAVKAGTGTSVSREEGGNFVVSVSTQDLVTSVNGKKGDVTVDAETMGLAQVAFTGNFSDLIGAPESGVLSVNGQTGAVTVDKDTLGLADVAVSGKFSDLIGAPESGVLSVNGQTGAVTIDKDTLGLGALAAKDTISSSDIGAGAVMGFALGRRVVGSNNLALNAVITDAIKDGAVTGAKLAEDAISAGDGVTVTREDGNFKVGLDDSGLVTSVNGQTGAVTVDKQSLGLADVTSERQMPLSATRKGVDYDSLFSNGFYHLEGTVEASCNNSPYSIKNTAPTDCSWFVLVMTNQDNSASVQMAFSARGDNSIRLRSYAEGKWGAWKNMFE